MPAKEKNERPIEVEGHRGCRGLFPENTLVAFASAIDAGVGTLEMDILATKEGVLVVYHDYFLNTELSIYHDGKPIPEGTLVCHLTLEELKEIDCGSKTNGEFPSQKNHAGAQIPTLEEVLDLVKDRNIELNLDIKRNPEHPEYTLSASFLAQKVVSCVSKAGWDSKTHYASFDVELLKEIRKIHSKARLRLIVDDNLEEARLTAKRLNVSSISPEHILLKTEYDVKNLQNSGFTVTPWTVNESKRWQELINMGVDGIITDYPHYLINFLKL